MEASKVGLPRQQVYLFCEDAALISEVEITLLTKGLTVIIKRRLSGDEAKANLKSTLFLVHIHPGREWPKAILESLWQQEPQTAQRTLLITEGLPDATLQLLMKRLDVWGYIPRSSLVNLLKSRVDKLYSNPETLRRHERVHLAMPVKYSDRLGQHQAVCTSLSEGGMFVQTPTPAKKAETVTLFLTIPKIRLLEAIKANVLYTTPVGFAARFESNQPLLLRQLSG